MKALHPNEHTMFDLLKPYLFDASLLGSIPVVNFMPIEDWVKFFTILVVALTALARFIRELRKKP